MDDDQRKHLDFIQAVISRMAANSFALKGWTVGATSALLAFAAGTDNRWVALIALLPSCVFWALDGYYLAMERRYRALYDAVVASRPSGGGPSPAPTLYSMDITAYGVKEIWFKAMFTRSVAPIHFIAIVTVGAVVAISSCTHSDSPRPTPIRIVDPVVVRPLPR